MKKFSEMIKEIGSFCKRETVQWTVILVIILSCFLYLFVDQLKEQGFFGAVFHVTIIILFVLSFLTPVLLIGKYKKNKFYSPRKFKITLILYLVGMIIAGLTNEKWEIIFIFPGISILWLIVTFIKMEVKKLLKI